MIKSNAVAGDVIVPSPPPISVAPPAHTAESKRRYCKKMSFKFVIRNDKVVKKALRDTGRGLLKIAIVALTEYIIGDRRHGLKHDDPYKFVSRKRAYGKVSDAPAGYFSWAQFRYVAKITEGFTKFGRKNSPTNSSESWGYVLTKGGYGATLTNFAPSTKWIRGENTQARQPTKVGWRKVSVVIKDNIRGAMRHVGAEVNKFLKSKARKS